MMLLLIVIGYRKIGDIMTKILFNSSLINQNLIPNLDAAMANLKKAIEVYNNIYIPSNFKYATYLNELKEGLYNQQNKIDNIKYMLNKNNQAYNEIARLSSDSLTMITNIKISKRDSVVR